MSSFYQWLEESKKEVKPELLGFVLRYSDEGNIITNSPIIKTYHEARAERMREFNKTERIGVIFGYFSDKTMRPVGNDYRGTGWHLNRAGQLINDYQVERSGRGKTNHSFLARNDREFQIYNALGYLHHTLRPGNMPGNSGDHAPEGFWQHVDSAVDAATKHTDLEYIGELFDFIQENYPHDDENVTTCLMIIRAVLNHYGYSIPEPPRDD